MRQGISDYKVTEIFCLADDFWSDFLVYGKLWHRLSVQDTDHFSDSSHLTHVDIGLMVLYYGLIRQRIAWNKEHVDCQIHSYWQSTCSLRSERDSNSRYAFGAHTLSRKLSPIANDWLIVCYLKLVPACAYVACKFLCNNDKVWTAHLWPSQIQKLYPCERMYLHNGLSSRLCLLHLCALSIPKHSTQTTTNLRSFWSGQIRPLWNQGYVLPLKCREIQ